MRIRQKRTNNRKDPVRNNESEEKILPNHKR